MLDDNEKTQYLDELFTLLKMPSISTLPEHKKDALRAANYVEKYLKKIGFPKTEQLYAKSLDKDEHHPLVWAERIDNPKNKTILIYGHYDVQPTDPIDEWKTNPFEPEVINENIYGRGTTDDKGQMFTHLAALDKLSKEWKDQWPVNVKVMIEGEEEVGGENIEELIKENANTNKFSADVCLISDTGFVAEGKPTIEYGLRGMAYFQIDAKLADADLHSGLFGGAVLNPAIALTEILSKLHDEKGKISIPHFYDDVIDIDEAEREKLSKIPFDKETFLKEACNSKDIYGEEGYSSVERTSARPALDINGIWSGFTGEGAKTIIPKSAHAKFSIRTVGNQDPRKLSDLVIKHIKEITPKEVDVEVSLIHVGDGVLINLDSENIKLASQSLKETFGSEVIFSRSGGSIPVVALIKNTLKVDPILIGYGLPDDNLHSPNEKMSLNHFYKGIECNINLYKKFGELGNN